MLAGTYNMLAEQGSTLYRVISLEYPDLANDPSGETYLKWDLDGYTARMQVRRLIEDTNYMIEITTENGGIDVKFDAEFSFDIEIDPNSDKHIDVATLSIFRVTLA